MWKHWQQVTVFKVVYRRARKIAANPGVAPIEHEKWSREEKIINMKRNQDKREGTDTKMSELELTSGEKLQAQGYRARKAASQVYRARKAASQGYRPRKAASRSLPSPMFNYAIAHCMYGSVYTRSCKRSLPTPKSCKPSLRSPKSCKPRLPIPKSCKPSLPTQKSCKPSLPTQENLQAKSTDHEKLQAK